MNKKQLVTVPESVAGELVDSEDRCVPSEALGKLGRELVSSSGIASLLLPKEKRAIARQLQDSQEQRVLDVGLRRLQGEANTRVVEIKLDAEQQRTEILVSQNHRMGNLKNQEKALVAQALRNVVSAEKEDQQELSSCDMLPKDQVMLSELFKLRAAGEMESIGVAHGLRLGEPLGSPEQSDELPE